MTVQYTEASLKWPTPMPWREPTAQPVFPSDVLRGAERLIHSIAASCGAPCEYAAFSFLTVCAAMIGNSRRVSPRPDWEEASALMVILLGPPSSAKSPVIAIFQRAVASIEARLRADAQAAKAAHMEAVFHAHEVRRAWQASCRKAARDGLPLPEMPAEAIAPLPPPGTRIVTTDVSYVKLLRLVSENRRGMFGIFDESGGILSTKVGGAGSLRRILLQGTSGNAYTLDRADDSGELYVPHLLVNLLGAAQPDLFRQAAALANDGLLARFIAVWPEAAPRTLPTDPVEMEKLTRIFWALYNLEWGKDGAPIVRHLSNEAAQEFFAWWLEQGGATHGDSLMDAHLGKMPGLVLRLALILEYVWWGVNDGAPEPTEVSHLAVLAALEVAESFLRPMAAKVYGEIGLSHEDARARTLAEWIERERPSEINLRDLRRRGGLPGLTSEAPVRAAVAELVELGWLIRKEKQNKQVGRPAETYLVNPRLWSEEAA